MTFQGNSAKEKTTPITIGVYIMKRVHNGKKFFAPTLAASLSLALALALTACDKVPDEIDIGDDQLQTTQSSSSVETDNYPSSSSDLSSSSSDKKYCLYTNVNDSQDTFCEECHGVAGIYSVEEVSSCPNQSSSSAALCGEHDPSTHFCDSRDSKVYKWVKIGSQTWMAENLNHAVSRSKCSTVISDFIVTKDALVDEDTEYCGIYGRLYDWATAMDLPSEFNTTPIPITNCRSINCVPDNPYYQGICPDGWHIPRQAEWIALAEFAGGTGDHGQTGEAGTKLKAASGWNDHATHGNGTDDYGFAALPGGHGGHDDIMQVGREGKWWSSSEGQPSDGSFAYGRGMIYNKEDFNWFHGTKGLMLNIRCVKD
jgi:uncharacterized protein (TIGR02145 family)